MAHRCSVDVAWAANAARVQYHPSIRQNDAARQVRVPAEHEARVDPVRLARRTIFPSSETASPPTRL